MTSSKMTTSNITLAVLLLFRILGRGESFLSINVDEEGSGLYFEEASKMYFYNHEWTIVSNVNLTKYRTELNMIEDVVKIIMNSCDELKLIEVERNASSKGNEGCGPIMYRFGVIMADIKENDSNWFGKDTRVKRNIDSELVSDDWPEDYSSVFEEFTNMSASGKETNISPDKQTSYITSTLNSVGKLAGKNLMAINDYVAAQLSFVHNTLAAARNGSVNAVRLFQLTATIQDVISYQMQILTNFSSKQKQYLSIVSLAEGKNAQIPNLFSSDTLISELNYIRNIVSEKGLDFPMKLTTENVHFLFHLSTPEIVSFRDQTFVSFQLPLISKLSGNHFTLFKVTSALHFLKRNLYSFVVPNHEFIAIDAHKEHYATLSFEDFNNCKRMSNMTAIICKQTSPLMSALTSSECEISVLQKRAYSANETNNCNTRYIRTNAEIFIKVLKPNGWLITMPQIAKVRYMCERHVTQQYSIEINGLLTIDSNCQFATDNVALTAHHFVTKSSIHEHASGNFSRKWEDRRETLERILADKDIATNDIPQVIRFGEIEKLLRISFGIKDMNMQLQISNLTNSLDQHERSFDLLMVYWGVCAWAAFSAFSLSLFVFIKYVRKLENVRRIEVDMNSLNSVKPSAPSTIESQ